MLHRRPVGAHGRQVGLDLDVERVVVGEGHQVVGERAEHDVHVGAGRELAELLARDGEPPEVLEVVDENPEVVDLAVHASDDVEAAIVGKEGPVVAQHLAVAGHDCHQVAELVAEHAQQLVSRETGERIVAGVPHSHVRRRLSPPAMAA